MGCLQVDIKGRFVCWLGFFLAVGLEYWRWLFMLLGLRVGWSLH